MNSDLKERVLRAIEMLGNATEYLRNSLGDTQGTSTIRYDNTDCDALRLANDCGAASAELLEELVTFEVAQTAAAREPGGDSIESIQERMRAMLRRFRDEETTQH